MTKNNQIIEFYPFMPKYLILDDLNVVECRFSILIGIPTNRPRVSHEETLVVNT